MFPSHIVRPKAESSGFSEKLIIFATLKCCEVLCHFKKEKFKRRVCTRLLDFYADPVLRLKFF